MDSKAELLAVFGLWLWIAVILAVVTVVHLLWSALTKSASPSLVRFGSVLLALMASAGMAFLWAVSPRNIPLELRIAAICLYFAGIIVYVEVRSLLSRGYSLRILVDLLQRGGCANVHVLKAEYGDGMGIAGILKHRLQGMAAAGLLQFDGSTVGPLTPRGRLLAAFMSQMRQLLRLERVG